MKKMFDLCRNRILSSTYNKGHLNICCYCTLSAIALFLLLRSLYYCTLSATALSLDRSSYYILRLLLHSLLPLPPPPPSHDKNYVAENKDIILLSFNLNPNYVQSVEERKVKIQTLSCMYIPHIHNICI